MNKKTYSIAMMCRLYDVSRDGYNAWRRRGKSLRHQEDDDLYQLIRTLFHQSGGLYGSPKIHAALQQRGVYVGKKRVARIMRENGLRARVATLYRSNPAHHAFFSRIQNHQLTEIADRCDRVWVGDVTYLKVNEQWRYLAVILDKYSRRLIAWSLSNKRDVNLTQSVLERAIRNRGVPPGLIFHSDRGVEYVAYAFRNKLSRYGITQSMNRPRYMNDNAHMESFFHNFKAERIHRKRITSDEMLRSIITEYTHFYNQVRLHSSIGYLPPAEYERTIN
jgi:putative transposase